MVHSYGTMYFVSGTREAVGCAPAWSLLDGSNDTANATGPFSAVYLTYAHGLDDCDKPETPAWIMAVAGFFVFLGVATLVRGPSMSSCTRACRKLILVLPIFESSSTRFQEVRPSTHDLEMHVDSVSSAATDVYMQVDMGGVLANKRLSAANTV